MNLTIDKSKWKKVRLGDVATAPSIRINNPSESGFERFIGNANIGQWDFRLTSWEPTDSVTSAMKGFETGDYLFVRRSLYASDFRERSPRASFAGVCSGDIITIREKPDRLADGFLVGVLNSPEIWKYVVANASGSITRRIKWRDLANYEFPLPPKDQQAKLAELLWAADAAVKANRHLREQCEQFQSSRTRDVLTSAGTEKLTQSKLGSIPAEWKCLSLQELLDCGAVVSHLDGNHGSDYPRNEEFVNSGVPYISANCIEGGTVDFGKAKYLTVKRAARVRKGVALDGDVLLAHNATVGPVSMLRTNEEKVILGTSLTYYRVDPERLSSDYLLSYMKSRFFQKQLEQVMNQSTRNQVPITTQRKLLFLVPPRDQQEHVARTVNDLSKPITAATSAVGSSQSLLKSLINQIF